MTATKTRIAHRTTDSTERTETLSAKSVQSVVSAVPGARSVLGMQDVAPYLGELLQDALALKAQGKKGPLPQSLAGKAILMVYEKNSTRTRVSFEVGVQRLGGIAVNLDAQTSQLARGESMEDTAQVLSRYGHALVYRANRHHSLEALPRSA